MLSEDRIRIMTKLAVHEEANGKSTKIASGYFRKDYISYHMIWTAIISVGVFLLVLLLAVCYNFDFLLGSIHTMDIIGTCKIVVFCYLIFLFVLELISYFVYKRRYLDGQKRQKEYCRLLHSLERIYNNERTKTDYIGGASGDDDFTRN